jgi:hypothetical protein
MNFDSAVSRTSSFFIAKLRAARRVAASSRFGLLALALFVSVDAHAVPSPADDSATVAEDTVANTIDVAANDGADAIPSSVTISTQPLNGVVANNGDGTVDYTPDANYFGPDPFTYSICDANPECATATVNVTVTNVNDPPIANDDTANVPEDSVEFAIDVAANDTDLLDGDTLTVASASMATGGTGSVTPSGGDVLYTPPTNFTGSATINYTISDGNGGTDNASVAVTVINVNDPPVAVDDTATVNEDSSNNSINVTGNDTDIDGDSLTVASASMAIGGTGTVTFTPNSSNVIYTPPANFSGDARVDYTVSDGNGGTDDGVLTVTVNNLNDPPVANPDALTVSEDSNNNVVDVLFNDDDPDGDTLTVTVATASNGTTALLGNGNVRYTPNPDYFGTDTISYSIEDGNGGTASSTVAVTVDPVPDAPVANNDTATVAEDSTNNIINVTANDTDVDGDTLTVTAASAANGSATPSGGNVSYTPPANFSGQTTISYTISDGNGGEDSATVAVTVTGQNDPPVANNDVASVAEDTVSNVINVTANDTDPDGDTLTVSAATTSTGSVSPSGGNVLYTPPLDFVGQATINYTITDGNGGSDSAIVTVTVTNRNDSPTAVNDTATVQEDSSNNVIDVTENDFDLDGDTLTVTSANAQNGNASPSGGTVVYTPDPDFNGQDTITYTITDGNGGSDSAVVTVTVNNVNDPPEANNDTANVEEDSEDNVINVTANDTDVDDDNLSVTSATASNGTATPSGGNVLYTPDANYFGQDTINYTITDGNGGTDSATVSVTVASVDDPPQAVDDAPPAIDEGGTIDGTFNVLDNDENLETTPMSAVIVSPPSNASSFALNGDGTFVYTHNGGETTSDSFTYQANNGQLSNTATVSITINAVNDAPVFISVLPPGLSTPEDTTLTIPVSALEIEDPDSDPSSFVLTLDPVLSPGANYTLAGPASITPAENFNGDLSVRATVSDGLADSAPFVIPVTVTAENDAPVLITEIESQTAIENSPFTLDVFGNFSDSDISDTLTFSATGLPNNLNGGSFSIDAATGIISGTPTVADARDNAPYIVTVTAQDPAGASVSDEFDLIVSALDRANVGLTIGVSPESGLPNDQLQWTFTAANQGPAPGENVELTGSFFGDGLSVAAGSGSICSITLETGRADFACTIGALPEGTTASVNFTTTASQATEVVAFGTAAGAQAVPIDPNISDNSAVRAVGVADSFSDGAVQFLGAATIRSVAAGDLNGDGRIDLVVGTAAGQPVQVYLGDDPRESCGCQRDFVATPLSIPDTGSNEGIAVADFDNDGNLDIVIANGGAQPDAVYHNTGSGNFVLSALLAPSSARDVAVGDFNNDGNADIAIAATSPNPVYFGDGAGGFGAGVLLGDDESFDVAVGRFDNDLFDDLVFANVGTDSQVWINNGGTGFTPGTTLQIGDATSVAAADLNGDNLDDLVFGRISGGADDIPANPVLINQGGATFGASPQLLGISPTVDVLIGDVSDDGLPDLVFVNESGVHQIWIANAGNYALHAEQVIDIGAAAGVLADLGFADADDPGGVDLAIGGAPSAGAAVYLNDSAGNLGLGDAVAPVITLNGEAAVNVPSGEAYSDSGATAADNIDGDISASIVVSNPVNTAVVGAYTVTYNVQDFAGNGATQVTRTVNVTAATGRGGGGGGSLGYGALALLVAMQLLFLLRNRQAAQIRQFKRT